jgi:hypothetical protein
MASDSVGTSAAEGVFGDRCDRVPCHYSHEGGEWVRSANPDGNPGWSSRRPRYARARVTARKRTGCGCKRGPICQSNVRTTQQLVKGAHTPENAVSKRMAGGPPGVSASSTRASVRSVRE